MQSLDCINSTRRVWQVLLFSFLRRLLPLPVRFVHLAQKKVHRSRSRLHRETIRTARRPLQVFLPIGTARKEVVKHGVRLVIGIIRPTLL